MKKIIIALVILIVLFGVAVGVYFSPIGDNFLKKYIVSKICFGNKFTPVYFNHSFNSFSMILKNNQNKIQIFGTLFPFKAVYDAKIPNIKSVFPDCKGEMLLMGNINKSNEGKMVGDMFFAKGVAKLDLKCNKNRIEGEIKGKNFDTSKFLNLFDNLNLNDFNISVKGVNNIYANVKNYILIKSDFRGKIIIFNKEVPLQIKNLLDIDKNSVSYRGIISGKDIDGIIKIYNNNRNSMEYLGRFDKINLNLFKPILLIPIRKKVSLNIFYDPLNKIYDFKSGYFSGFYKKPDLVLQFKMPSFDFFEFLSLPEIINGVVTGNIHVNNKNGSFNILMENAVFKNYVLNYLNRFVNVGCMTKNRGKIFATGTIDNKKIVFDLISKDLNCFWSIKHGVYYFDGKYHFVLKLNNGKYTYFLDINNSDIKLLKKIGNKQSIETLVY